MSTRIRIGVAEGHPIYRAGLYALLHSHPDFQIAFIAKTGTEALDRTLESPPAVLLLDVQTPGLSGYDVARVLRLRRSATRCILIAREAPASMIERVKRTDIRGCVDKDGSESTLLDAIRTVASGGTAFPSEAMGVPEDKFQRPGIPRGTRITGLTTAERRVLVSIARLKTSREIALEHSISVRTVEKHRSNIAQKFALHGANMLLAFAIKYASRL